MKHAPAEPEFLNAEAAEPRREQKKAESCHAPLRNSAFSAASALKLQKIRSVLFWLHSIN